MMALIERFQPQGNPASSYGSVVIAALGQPEIQGASETLEESLVYWLPEWSAPTSTSWTIEPSRGPQQTLAQELANAYLRFAKTQVALDERIARAVADNLWDLYAR